MAAELSDLPPLPAPQNQALVDHCLDWAEGSACDNETAKLMAAEIRWLRHEVNALRSPAAARHVLDQLTPLCPCGFGHPDSDGPQRECPIHGDGETFVAYVQALEAVALAWRELVAHNPQARLCGGRRSQALWSALDVATGLADPEDGA